MVCGTAAWATEACQQQIPSIRFARPVEQSLHYVWALEEQLPASTASMTSFLCNLPFAICPWHGVRSHPFSVTEICYAFSVITNAFSWWSFLFPRIFITANNSDRDPGASAFCFPIIIWGFESSHHARIHHSAMCYQTITVNPTWLHSSTGFLHNLWSLPNDSNMRLCDTRKRDS